MTKHEIATLACKILSLYAFISSVPYLAQGLYFWELPQAAHFTWGMLLAVFAPPVFLIVAGALLWRWADRLAARMVSRVEAQPEPVVSADLRPLAFSVVGLLVLVWGSPRSR